MSRLTACLALVFVLFDIKPLRFAGGSWAPPTSLIGHWKLSEASGARADDRSTYNLTDNNTVNITVYGPVGNVANQVGASTQDLKNLNFGSPIDLSLGYTMVGWYKQVTALGSMYQMVGGQGGDSLFSFESIDGNYVRLLDRGPANLGATVNIPNKLGHWYFGVTGYDASQKKNFCSINGATRVYSTAYSPDPTFRSPQQIFFSNIYDNNFTGNQARYLLYNRVLSDPEIAVLFNGGTGATTYSTLTTAQKVGLTSAWDMTADGSDSAGANTLTNLNGVTFVASTPGTKRGISAYFIRANSEKLTTASTIVLPASYTLIGWVKFAASASGSPFFNVSNNWTTQIQLSFSLQGADNILQANVADGSALDYSQSLLPGGVTMIDGNYHCVAAWFDGADKKIHTSIDNGTADNYHAPSGLAGTPYRTAATLSIGGGTGGYQYYDGMAQEFSLFNVVLNATQRAFMCSATPPVYPFPGFPS